MTSKRRPRMIPPEWESLEAFLACNTEERIRDWMTAQAWPGGFLCGSCGGRRAYWIQGRRAWQCVGCRRQVRLSAAAQFKGLRKPLVDLAKALYLVVSSGGRITVRALQEAMGFSYATAWEWRDRILRYVDSREDLTAIRLYFLAKRKAL